MGDTSSRKIKRSCAVPKCTSTAIKCPNKYFFSSPADVKRRSLWLKAMRRNVNDLSKSTNFFVCEDHFDLENDLTNYTAFRLGFFKKGLLKSSAVPKLFECQSKGEKKEGRPASKKRETKRVIDNILNPVEEITEENMDIDFSPTIEDIPIQQITHQNKNTQTIKSDLQDHHFRSKGVQCSLLCDSFLKMECESNPLEPLVEIFEDVSESGISAISSCSSNPYSESCSSQTFSQIQECEKPFYVQYSKEYTGIVPESLHIVEILSELTNSKSRDIFIVFMKIRKNYTFSDISHRFNMDERTIRRNFLSCIQKIAPVMKHFIKWPTPAEVKLRLPLAFRLNFDEVYGIIDCFEIEIQKPSNPVLQALTWSEYKKTNTMKYLICSTPDGLIIFTSIGFGGRTSDIEVTKQSNFISEIPNNCSIMADRGFKGIDTLLSTKNCSLIRPPSVKSGSKMSKEEVYQTKQIASLRIHIERVIKRVREFALLKPHSCIPHGMVKYLDHCVTIAAATINLQPVLIKME